MPEPGPPDLKKYGQRRNCHMPAYSLSELDGGATIDNFVEFERCAAVDRHAQTCVYVVDAVRVRRIDRNLRVVEGPY